MMVRIQNMQYKVNYIAYCYTLCICAIIGVCLVIRAILLNLKDGIVLSLARKSICFCEISGLIGW